MKKISSNLEKGVFEILKKLEEQLGDHHIQVFVAGGVAVSYHTGERSTRDVDLFFSHRILPDWKRLVVKLEDNQILYADPNYTPNFGLLHPDFDAHALLWDGFKSEKINLKVLSPLDLAVSKLSRLSDIDRADIKALSLFFSYADFFQRATEAMQFYVGNLWWIKEDLEDLREFLKSETEIKSE